MTLHKAFLLFVRGRRLMAMVAVYAALLVPLSACNMIQGLLVSTDSEREKMQRIARDVMAAQTTRLMAQSTRAALASQKLGVRVNSLQAERDSKLDVVNDSDLSLMDPSSIAAIASATRYCV